MTILNYLMHMQGNVSLSSIFMIQLISWNIV